MAPPREQANRTSSANPFKLQQYATDGMAMGTTLQDKATALSSAADALARRGESIPGLGDFLTGLGDLAADWYHLDEFAGDVANGFLVHLGSTPPRDPDTFVMTVDNATLMDLGQIGWADRDEAIAEAEELAHELRALMADLEDGEPLVHDPPRRGGISLDQMELLASRIDGRGDPAFAVAFLEAMGVNGIVDMQGLFHDYAVEAREVDRPRDGYWTDSRIAEWTEEQMVPVAAVLSTAMDTRARTDDRHDPANDAMPDDARLSEEWVNRFERYGGDAQVDYSELVHDADLPADVLVGVGNHHLGDVFGHPDGDRGPSSAEADRNILDAIGANPDASVGWLGSDGIAPGTDNIELVLTYDGRVPGDDGLAHHGGAADLYDSMADVVETGLTHPSDAAGRAELMGDAIAIVGAEGDTLWQPPDYMEADDAAAHMRQSLAAGVASNMDVVHSMVTDGWGDVVFDEPPENAGLTHEFMREVMGDEEAANRVAGAYQTWALDQLSNLPAPDVETDPGNRATDREGLLHEIGAVEGVIIQAENNALLGSIEDRIERQQARARLLNAGVDGTAFAAGFLPFVGEGIDFLETASDMANLSAGDVVFPSDYASLDESTQQTTANEFDASINFTILSAIAEHPEAAPQTLISEWSDQERQEFIEWVRTVYDVSDHGVLMDGFTSAERAYRGAR